MKKITKLSDLNNPISPLKNKEGQVIPTTLDQILGRKENLFDIYGTDSVEEYKEKLNNLNTAELRNHALTLKKFNPDANRDRLVKQLLNEFNQFRSFYDRPPTIDSNTKLSKRKMDQALKIMSAAK